MSKVNIIALQPPNTDPLLEVLRERAQRLLAQAIEVEVEDLLEHRQDQGMPEGRAELVHRRYLPEVKL